MRSLLALLVTLGGIGCGGGAARTWTPAECLADRACPVPLVSAHRGNCGAGEPENTIAAYVACEARGVPMVEIDPRQTVDGFFVVMHDDTVDRTTDGETRFPGRTAVAQLTLAEFQSLVIDDPRCVDDPDADPDRCHPATLAAALQRTGLLFDLDFKAGDAVALGELVLAHGAASRVLLFDSNVQTLREYRTVVPDGVVMPRAYVDFEFQTLVGPDNADLDLRWVHGEASLIAEETAILGPADVRLYVNGWDASDGPDLFLALAAAGDPAAAEAQRQRAWESLEAMIAAGARCFGTDYGDLYSAYLYPAGFGK
jgi:glycerophosphoryl diester phosphodiesterase